MNTIECKFYALHRYVINWWPHGHVYKVKIESNKEINSSERKQITSLMSHYNNSFLVDVEDPFYTYMRKSGKYVDSKYKFIEYSPQTPEERSLYGACVLKEGVCYRLYIEVAKIIHHIKRLTLLKGPTRDLRSPWKESQSFLMRLSHLISDEDDDNWKSEFGHLSFDAIIAENPSAIRDVQPPDNDSIITLESLSGELVKSYEYDAGDRYEAD